MSHLKSLKRNFHLYNEKRNMDVYGAIADRIGRIKLIEFESVKVKESC